MTGMFTGSQTVGTTAGVPSSEVVAHVDMVGVRAWLTANATAMVDDLSSYVAMETPSNSRPHLQRGLAWIENWLAEPLGAPDSRTVTGGGEFGDTLVLDYAGVGSRPLLLLCHYDTVWDAGTLVDWPFQVNGSTAIGPGVFDMKAGLVQVAWALRALSEHGLSRPPIRLLLNGDEELGSISSRPVIEAAADGVAAVLVLEPAAEGAVKTSRSGVGIWRVDVTGVEAHAGLDPSKGASAIDELARVILLLRTQEALDRGTSVNVGTIQGGTRSNVIAGHARAALDVRVTCAEEARRMEAAIEFLAPSEPRLRIAVDGGWNRPVMERTKATADMFEFARALAARQGLILTETSAGGGSDANFIAGRGIPVLDGLGAVGAGAHGRDEHVDVDAMPERAALLAAIVHAFSLGDR